MLLYATGPIGNLPCRFETIDESRRKITEQGVEISGPRIAVTWFLNGESTAGYRVCAELSVKASLQAALAGLAAMERRSGISALEKILMPTLVLWGDGDRASNWSQPERLWRDIADAQLAVIAGCAHAVHLEKPHLFNAMIKDFLLSAGT